MDNGNFVYMISEVEIVQKFIVLMIFDNETKDCAMKRLH